MELTFQLGNELIKVRIDGTNATFANSQTNFTQFVPIEGLSLSKEGIIKEPHLSGGGVGPIPMYLEKACKYLDNKEIIAEVVKEAARIADTEISPIDDVRGTAKYKRLLLRQLIYAHFITLKPELEVLLWIT